MIPGNEMSSDAATRARQLLASKETDLLTIKDRSATPTTIVGADQSTTRQTARQGKNVRVETMEESSSRLREILEKLEEKRENFNCRVHCANTPNHSSNNCDSISPSEPTRSSPSSGKPPRFSTCNERDDLNKRMCQSLKEKRDRITRLLSVDQQKLRIMSRSPHTVDTATDTTEDSHSTGSWSAENVQHVVEDYSKAAAPLQDIEEAFEYEEHSIQDGDAQRDSRMEKDEPLHCGPQSAQDESGQFLPINPDESETENYVSQSMESIIEDGEAEPNTSLDESDESNHVRPRAQGSDKKVSFGDTLFVIEEMTPPEVVHCTSFESAFSRERSLSGYSPDDLSASIGATESPIRSSPLRKTSSWDASDADENEAKQSRYKSLIEDREKRVSLMRKLEETYTELITLHEELEYTRQQEELQQRNVSDDDSDFSCTILDEESSCEFTDDSNTSGWISQDESNSKLDSLLQYMTSEDDESYAESYASQGRLSLSLSQTLSNLDTLVETDETEEQEDSSKEPDSKTSLPESAASLRSTNHEDSEDTICKKAINVAARRAQSSGAILIESRRSEEDTSFENLGRVPDDVDTDSFDFLERSPDSRARRAAETSSSQRDATRSTRKMKHNAEEKKPTAIEITDNRKGPKAETVKKPRDEITAHVKSSEIRTSDDLYTTPAPQEQVTVVKSIVDPKDSVESQKKAIATSVSKDSRESSASTKKKGVTKSSSKDSRDSSSKKKSVKKAGSKDSKDSKSKVRSSKKFSVETIKIPSKIRIEQRSPNRGTVKREIDKWEAATGNPGRMLEDKPRKPDPPVFATAVFSIDEYSLQEDKKEERKEAAPVVVEAASPNVDQGLKEDTSQDGLVEMLIPPRERRRRLFIPTKISNRRCRASGGLFDLARKTGISHSSTICVKSVDIPRPPELTAINTEFACGTQGSLYNLAVRSGCKIAEQPVPKRLKMPPLSGGKRRWLLKARGGHYHLSVWTTISNAVLTARVGYAVQEIKRGKLEQRTDIECGARGTRHIAERSECG